MKKEINTWADITPDMCQLWSSKRIWCAYRNDDCWQQWALYYIKDGKRVTDLSDLLLRINNEPFKRWSVFELETKVSPTGIEYHQIVVVEWGKDYRPNPETTTQTEDFLNKMIVVNRKDGSIREVMIMFDRASEKYAFVNLTTFHICKCRFDTPEDALKDLQENDNVVAYHIKK